MAAVYIKSRGVVARGQEDHGPQFFEIAGFSEILMFLRKIIGLLPMVKIKDLNFIGNL